MFCLNSVNFVVCTKNQIPAINFVYKYTSVVKEPLIIALLVVSTKNTSSRHQLKDKNTQLSLMFNQVSLNPTIFNMILSEKKKGLQVTGHPIYPLKIACFKETLTMFCGRPSLKKIQEEKTYIAEVTKKSESSFLHTIEMFQSMLSQNFSESKIMSL